MAPARAERMLDDEGMETAVEAEQAVENRMSRMAHSRIGILAASQELIAEEEDEEMAGMAAEGGHAER